jgi:hypothetical protein
MIINCVAETLRNKNTKQYEEQYQRNTTIFGWNHHQMEFLEENHFQIGKDYEEQYQRNTA